MITKKYGAITEYFLAPVILIALIYLWSIRPGIKNLICCLAATVTFPIFPQKLDYPLSHLTLHLLKNGYLRPNWGSYLDLPTHPGLFLLLAGLLLLGLALYRRPPFKSFIFRGLSCIIALVFLLGTYYTTWPKGLTDRELAQRAQVEVRIGRYDLAYADLALIGRDYPDFPLKRLIEILLDNIWKETDRVHFAYRVLPLYQGG